MPSGPLVASRLIVNTVLATAPKRVLDLGMGTGKYGFLIREQSDLAGGRVDRETWQMRIDGVEGYEAYIGGHQHAIYDSITISDIVEFLSRADSGSYDIALALDVVEHFTPNDAIAFVNDALRVSTYVLISTPKGFYAKCDAANELETHRSWWPTKALKELAAACGAYASIAQVRMVNLALLCRTQVPPSFKLERVFEVASLSKDILLPELWYYRAIHKAGPSILDTRS